MVKVYTMPARTGAENKRRSDGRRRAPGKVRYSQFLNALERCLRNRGEPIHRDDVSANITTTKGGRWKQGVPSHTGMASVVRGDPERRFVYEDAMITLVDWGVAQ